MTEKEEKRRRDAWRRYTKEGGLHIPSWMSARPRKSRRARSRLLEPEQLEIGNIYHVKIHGISDQGIGIARIAGQLVLVPNTRVKEWVAIRITGITQEKYFVGEVMKRK